MLNVDGNENGKKKKTIVLISKKKSFASAAPFFVHLFDVVLHDDNVKRPSYTSHRKCRMCSPKLLLLVSLFVFFFTAAHFTSLAASISHFLTANFHVFVPTKFVSFVLYLTLYLSPCYPSQ